MCLMRTALRDVKISIFLAQSSSYYFNLIAFNHKYRNGGYAFSPG